MVIEIKPVRLDAGALGQALYYASSLAHFGGNDLFEKLQPGLGRFGDVEMLSARVKELLDGEGDGTKREIAVLLVGAGIHPGLARMNDFLGRYAVPISVVSFEVFGLNRGPQLLIRERTEEPTEAPRPRRRYTVEAIRAKARDKVTVPSLLKHFMVGVRRSYHYQPTRFSNCLYTSALSKNRFVEPLNRPVWTGGHLSPILFASSINSIYGLV